MKKIFFSIICLLLLIAPAANADSIMPRGKIKKDFDYCVRVKNISSFPNYLFIVARPYEQKTSIDRPKYKLNPEECLPYKDEVDNLLFNDYYRIFSSVSAFDRRFVNPEILQEFDSLAPGAPLPEKLFNYFKDPYYITGADLLFLSAAGSLIDQAPIKKILRNISLENISQEKSPTYIRIFFKDEERKLPGCIQSQNTCYYESSAVDSILQGIASNDWQSINIYYKDNNQYLNTRYRVDFSEKSTIEYDDGRKETADKNEIEKIDDQYAIYPIINCNKYDGHCYKYGDCVDCLKTNNVIFAYVLLFIITILIEGFVFLLFGFRKTKNFLFLLIANLVSYPIGLAVYSFWSRGWTTSYISPNGWYLTEILVIIIESLILFKLLKSEYSKKRILFFVVIANIATAILGVFLKGFLINFF